MTKGVSHPDRPGQYLAAVECDGAAYHGALWARERDRLRQDILENLGWRFHRIWSTDWFHRREAEIARLRDALSQARDAAQDGIRPRGANHGAGPVVQDDPEPVLELAPPSLSAPPYRRADLQAPPEESPMTSPTPSWPTWPRPLSARRDRSMPTRWRGASPRPLARRAPAAGSERPWPAPPHWPCAAMPT